MPVDTPSNWDEARIKRSKRDTDPSIARIRSDTLPDFTLGVNKARASMREIKKRELPANFDDLPREEQIVALILHEDKIDLDMLNVFSKEVGDGKLRFLHYWLEDTTITYVYIDKDYKSPAYREPEKRWDDAKGKFVRDRIELPNLDVSVLLKVLMDGTAFELHRWEKEEQPRAMITGIVKRVEPQADLPTIIINDEE